jgi:hypothetical protein
MPAALRRDAIAPVSILGPNGVRMTLADLPAPDTRRWVIRRKAEVVTAVRGGLLTLEDALARYGLTPEEFAAWGAAFDHHGMAGLRTTRRTVRQVGAEIRSVLSAGAIAARRAR